jgi:predicted CoA-substrate-specific enzyme activase
MSGADGRLVGIDVGSTTVKGVVVDRATDGVVWRDYRRHEGRQAERTLELLLRMENEAGVVPGGSRVFLTGSGAAGLAPRIGARFVQEVLAVSMAVEKLHPDVRSVIEIGGQDAKIVVLRVDPASGRRTRFASMNDKCAGGTGADIDRMAAKLKVSAAELLACRYLGVRTHPVAGKCGVFAETDINGLQKQGIPTAELIASLFEAIVVQSLSVLTRGHTLLPAVLLLGGPNTFLPGLREAWRVHIARMWEERGVAPPEASDPERLVRAPEDGLYFAALGAVEFGRAEDESQGAYVGTGALRQSVEEGGMAEKRRTGVPGLSGSAAETEDFLRRHGARPFRARAFAPGRAVAGFVGLDGGSTSTKAVLLSEGGDVVAKAYQLSRGNPIQDTVDVFEGLRRQVEASGGRLEVRGVATTGYAKDLLRAAIGADAALVETVAHAQAAIHFYGKPDVIVDVGGQDIKLILLRDGVVTDFMLNTQCSAGNGYFLQSTAEDFGVPVDDYAEAALQARLMPVFGYGCAVFLQSEIVNFLRQGWSRAEILAALAAVLPKNIWLYVAKVASLPRLGRRFVLQGGTQRNLAAVKAQVDYIRRQFEGSGVEPEVIVHEHCGEAGAIGAALEARRLGGEGHVTSFIGLALLRRITWRTTTGEATRCSFCPNRCLRTFIDFRVDEPEDSRAPTHASKVPLRPGERRLIVATCEKGSVEDVASMRGIKARLEAVRRENPNLMEIAAREAFLPQRPPLAADPTVRGPSRAARLLAAPSRAARRAAAERRPRLRVGIPRVLALYQYAPFFDAYLESLGVRPENIVYSPATSERLYRDGARRGATDPCYPAKVAVAHVHHLVQVAHRRAPLDCIFLPMIDVVTPPLTGMLASYSCPMVSTTPEVVKAAFTKEADVFRDNGIRWISPLVNLADRALLARQLLAAWGDVLGLSEAENLRAIAQGFAAQERFQAGLERRSLEVLDRVEREGRLAILVLGRVYHHDSGVNHGILERLQALGYPILTQSTLPADPDLLDRLFGDEVRRGLVRDPRDVSDVWKNTTAAASCLKLWAAKLAARHPHLVAVELSSFKCGHDAPIFSVVRDILGCAGTPHFAFKDVDENRPDGAIKVRVETIHYFLARRAAALQAGEGRASRPGQDRLPSSCRSERETHVGEDGPLHDVGEGVLADLGVGQVGAPDGRDDPPVRPADAEGSVEHRVGVGPAVEVVGEHVDPERAVGMVEAQAADEAAPVPRHARVHPVPRRQADLQGRKRLGGRQRARVGLPGVVQVAREPVAEGVLHERLDAAVADRTQVPELVGDPGQEDPARGEVGEQRRRQRPSLGRALLGVGIGVVREPEEVDVVPGVVAVGADPDGGA